MKSNGIALKRKNKLFGILVAMFLPLVEGKPIINFNVGSTVIIKGKIGILKNEILVGLSS